MPPKTEKKPLKSALVTEFWGIDDVKPYVRNTRLHGEDQVRQIAASIERFGFTMPILASRDGTTIAGHGGALKMAIREDVAAPVFWHGISRARNRPRTAVRGAVYIDLAAKHLSAVQPPFTASVAPWSQLGGAQPN